MWRPKITEEAHSTQGSFKVTGKKRGKHRKFMYGNEEKEVTTRGVGAERTCPV